MKEEFKHLTLQGFILSETETLNVSVWEAGLP